jgi:hypothetical protein
LAGLFTPQRCAVLLRLRIRHHFLWRRRRIRLTRVFARHRHGLASHRRSARCTIAKAQKVLAAALCSAQALGDRPRSPIERMRATQGRIIRCLAPHPSLLLGAALQAFVAVARRRAESYRAEGALSPLNVTAVAPVTVPMLAWSLTNSCTLCSNLSSPRT